MNKEASVIEKIIWYSNELLMLLFAISLLKKYRKVTSECNTILWETLNHFPEMLRELNSQSLQIQLSIKSLLVPLFQGKNMVGYPLDGFRWSISSDELKDGYLLLSEADQKGDIITIDGKSIDWILLLRNFKDKKRELSAGTLLPKDKYAFIMGNIGKDQKSLIKPTVELYKKITKYRLI